MKIAMFFHNLIERGGTPRVTLNLAKNLQSKGHEVKIYTCYYNPKRCFPEINKDLDIRTIKIVDGFSQNSQQIIPRLKYGYDYFFRMKKLSELVDQNVDILYPNEAIVYVASLQIKKRWKKPVVWSCFDIASYVVKSQIGTLYTRSRIYRILLDLFAIYDKRIIKDIDRILVPNSKIKRLVDEYYGIQSMIVRSGGVDTQYFTKKRDADEFKKKIQKQFGIPSDAVIVLSAGMLLWHRRYEDVIKAVKILRDKGFNLHYVIVGSSKPAPDYKIYLAELVSSYGLRNFVHLVDGFVPDEELLYFYNICDIFVFPNVTQNWGLAPLEAMSVGKPVVLTSDSGVHELLVDGVHAMIVPPKSQESIADRISILLNDEKIREDIARNGNNFVLDNFSYSTCADRILDVLNSSLS